ncbi:MAG: DUF222 domain-containing protein [Desertimonas sp.]
MEATVDRVEMGIDALAGVDLDGLTDGELDSELVGLMRLRHRLDAEIARRVQRWDARTVWLSDGSRSPAARLSRDGLVSRPAADRLVSTCRAVTAMPRAAEAWAAGDIGSDHVDLLRRAAGGGRGDLFARDESLLVEHCATLRFAQATKAVRYWCQRADAELGADGTPPPPEVYARTAVSFQGSVSGEFLLDSIGGATFTACLERIERELYRQDQRDGVERTTTQRMAAAMVEMAVRAAAAPPDARRPEPLVMVLAGEASVEDICEMANGVVIDPHLVVPFLGRADIQTIIFDGAGQPISTSPQRTFRGALRRAIQVRDRHCQHPSGCDAPISECDIDHIIPDAAGGLTELTNGRLECEPHNRRADLHDKAPPSLLDDARHRREDEEREAVALRHRLDHLIALRSARDAALGSISRRG